MKSTRRTHFVPNVVFRTAFAGVVPVCVAASGCGATPGGGGGTDAAPDRLALGVACTSFQCMGVGLMAFADASRDAALAEAAVLGVACIGFDGGPCAPLATDATTGTGDGAARDDSGLHDATADVPIFAVAVPVFGDR